MSTPFRKASEFGGGNYFAPKNHMSDLAILLEPIAGTFRAKVPHTYEGVESTRDEISARLTIFANSDSINEAIPSEVLEDTKLTHGMLVGLAKEIQGAAGVYVLRKVKAGQGMGFAFRDEVSDEAMAAVTRYYEAREAAVAEALAEVPSFDD